MNNTPYPSDKPKFTPITGAPEGSQTVTVHLPDTKTGVVYVILALTVVVYLLQLASTNLYNGIDLPALLGMKINEWILQGEVWRFFTPLLLHGSVLHVAFNMYALYNIGRGLERFYGHGRFLVLYVLGGFAGNVFSFLLTSAPSLGSSTAIFGLLGAEAIFLYQNRHIFGRTAQRALLNILTIAGINLLIGMNPGIDNWGHVGGLLGGTLFAWLAGPMLQVHGLSPDLALVDQRQEGDTWRAALSVLVVFGLLAAFGFYIRLR